MKTELLWLRLCVSLALLLGAAVLFAIFSVQAGAQSVERSLDQGPGGAPYASGELLVSYEASASAQEIENVTRQVGGETLKSLPAVNARLLFFPEIKNGRARQARQEGLERRRQALERTPLVEAADYNYLREPSYTPSDTYFDGQWALEKIEAPTAWNREQGSGTRVAVVDTGIAQNHPDLESKISAQRDFVDGDSTAEDDYGHGTHVAGIAAAVTDNGRGIAGACPDCELLVAKALTSSGGFDSDIADGVIWATDNGASSVNLSLGGSAESRTLERAVDYAWNNGAVVAAASGNSGSDSKSYPAAYANAIAVSATDENDDLASFSNYGDWIDVAAPGAGIISTVPGGYSRYSGTSMATPHVAALAGLLAAQGLAASENRERIESSATDLGPAGEDEDYGRGRVNARQALGAQAESETDAASNPAFYEEGQWYLRETLDSGAADLEFKYRAPSSVPVTGDWNGDGTKTPGLYRSDGTWYLRNSNSGGRADIVFKYNAPDSVPVVGDWDGDGVDTPGLFRENGTWYLRNSNTEGRADAAFKYNAPDSIPVAGDWDGDGLDTPGLVSDDGTWYLRNSNTGGRAENTFEYYIANSVPVIGDWDGDGADSPGLFRSGTWHLRNSNTGGGAEFRFDYGGSGDTPLVW